MRLINNNFLTFSRSHALTFEGHIENCKNVLAMLEDSRLSGYVDDRNETIGRKIRDTEMKKVPYMLIVGDKEKDENLVALRKQGEGDKGQMRVDEFAEMLLNEINQV